MKIATFNINNINKRLQNLVAWLAKAQPDVVSLQELKAEQRAFPASALRDLGYRGVWLGELMKALPLDMNAVLRGMQLGVSFVDLLSPCCRQVEPAQIHGFQHGRLPLERIRWVGQHRSRSKTPDVAIPHVDHHFALNVAAVRRRHQNGSWFDIPIPISCLSLLAAGGPQCEDQQEPSS